MGLLKKIFGDYSAKEVKYYPFEKTHITKKNLFCAKTKGVLLTARSMTGERRKGAYSF